MYIANLDNQIFIIYFFMKITTLRYYSFNTSKLKHYFYQKKFLKQALKKQQRFRYKRILFALDRVYEYIYFKKKHFFF